MRITQRLFPLLLTGALLGPGLTACSRPTGTLCAASASREALTDNVRAIADRLLLAYGITPEYRLVRLEDLRRTLELSCSNSIVADCVVEISTIMDRVAAFTPTPSLALTGIALEDFQGNKLVAVSEEALQPVMRLLATLVHEGLHTTFKDLLRQTGPLELINAAAKEDTQLFHLNEAFASLGAHRILRSFGSSVSEYYSAQERANLCLSKLFDQQDEPVTKELNRGMSEYTRCSTSEKLLLKLMLIQLLGEEGSMEIIRQLKPLDGRIVEF